MKKIYMLMVQKYPKSMRTAYSLVQITEQIVHALRHGSLPEVMKMKWECDWWIIPVRFLLLRVPTANYPHHG